MLKDACTPPVLSKVSYNFFKVKRVNFEHYISYCCMKYNYVIDSMCMLKTVITKIVYLIFFRNPKDGHLKRTDELTYTEN